ncbi:hypothetical protein E8E11_010814 [Didymella keratinophila]|nr:hypothetical protein E8E11_010814 [Didymella keratinophila]
MFSVDSEKAVSEPVEPTGTPMTAEAAVPQPGNTLDRVETRASILYNSIPLWRKCIIVFACSWSTLAACFSSTSLLSASKEISEDLNTTSQVVTFSTAGLMMAMGMSALIWSPVASITGRRSAYMACTTVLLAFTIGSALAPTIEVFVAMRVLSGFQGCFYHVAGQTIIAEYFPPEQRGRANGFFLAGTVAGPPLGPLVAGIMVQYTSWRNVLWLQVAMIGLSLILAFFYVPGSRLDKPGLALNLRGWDAVSQFNPLPTFKQIIYPNVSFTHLSCGFLSWTQYSLLAAPRHVLSTRFGLTSSLTTGLFYIAPATGFLLGTVIEAIPKKRREIIAGKYMVQYSFSAISIASAVPLIEAVGTGPAGTIGAILAVLAGLLTFTTAKQGQSMQEWTDNRAAAKSSKSASNVIICS